jgi:riboflavin synthase alpha subunit
MTYSCQITMSDLMMNVHTWVTVTTTMSDLMMNEKKWVHSSLNQPYASDIQHGESSAINNICMYIHNLNKYTDRTYTIV